MADDRLDIPPLLAPFRRVPVDLVTAEVGLEVGHVFGLVILVQDAVGGGQDPVGVEDGAAAQAAVCVRQRLH